MRENDVENFNSKLNEFEKTTRGKRGILVIRDVKTNPYRVLKTFIVSKANIGYKIKNDIDYIKLTELPIVDRYSSGTTITKGKISERLCLYGGKISKSLCSY